MKVTTMPRAIVFTELKNTEILDAVSKGLAMGHEIYGAVPLDLEVNTWDTEYGDVLADGFVIVRPRATAWRCEERIKQHQEKTS